MHWRLARSLQTLRSQVNLAAPKRNKASDGTIGDIAHQSRSSDHNAWITDSEGPNVVSALDITHDPANGVDIARLAEVLRERRDARIKYVIANKKIFSSITSPWVWRPYFGSNPHTKHIHISVMSKKSLYDDDRAWNIADAFEKKETPIERFDGDGLDTEKELVAALEEAAQAIRGFEMKITYPQVVSLLNSLKQDD